MENIEHSLTPEEAAKFLGVSVQTLGRMRRNGNVHGTQVGNTNLYVYTISDLRKADLTTKKRGRKPKQ